MHFETLNILTEEYIGVREERLALDRKSADLKKKEEKLKTEIVKGMREERLFKIGKLTYRQEFKPVANDWLKIYQYIREHDAFDLLHKRLTETAVEYRWEAGEQIPGVGKFPVDKLEYKL